MGDMKFQQQVFTTLARMDSKGWAALLEATKAIATAAGVDVETVLGEKKDQEN